MHPGVSHRGQQLVAVKRENRKNWLVYDFAVQEHQWSAALDDEDEDQKQIHDMQESHPEAALSPLRGRQQGRVDDVEIHRIT